MHVLRMVNMIIIMTDTTHSTSSPTSYCTCDMVYYTVQDHGHGRHDSF